MGNHGTKLKRRPFHGVTSQEVGTPLSIRRGWVEFVDRLGNRQTEDRETGMYIYTVREEEKLGVQKKQAQPRAKSKLTVVSRQMRRGGLGHRILQIHPPLTAFQRRIGTTCMANSLPRTQKRLPDVGWG